MNAPLIDFAREIVGDRNWTPSPGDLVTMEHLDWRGPDRDAAAALVRWCYWEPRVAAAERGFYPGGVSRIGFLAWGENLAATVAEDGELLRALGADRRELGDCLKQVLDSAQEAARQQLIPPEGGPVSLAAPGPAAKADEGIGVGRLLVRLRAFRGFQRCPFADCPHFHPRQPAPHSGVEFHLRDRTIGTQLRGPGLAWHLIGAHGFFCGKGAPHRIDPALLLALLLHSRG